MVQLHTLSDGIVVAITTMQTAAPVNEEIILMAHA